MRGGSSRGAGGTSRRASNRAASTGSRSPRRGLAPATRYLHTRTEGGSGGSSPTAPSFAAIVLAQAGDQREPPRRLSAVRVWTDGTAMRVQGVGGEGTRLPRGSFRARTKPATVFEKVLWLGPWRARSP